jgi:hypothetical protein
MFFLKKRSNVRKETPQCFTSVVAHHLAARARSGQS